MSESSLKTLIQTVFECLFHPLINHRFFLVWIKHSAITHLIEWITNFSFFLPLFLFLSLSFLSSFHLSLYLMSLSRFSNSSYHCRHFEWLNSSVTRNKWYHVYNFMALTIGDKHDRDWQTWGWELLFFFPIFSPLSILISLSSLSLSLLISLSSLSLFSPFQLFSLLLLYSFPRFYTCLKQVDFSIKVHTLFQQSKVRICDSKKFLFTFPSPPPFPFASLSLSLLFSYLFSFHNFFK